MRPTLSPVISTLRSPLTAWLVTTPSLAALPANIPIIRPIMPSNLIWVLSRVLTSASAGLAVTTTSGRASTHDCSRRFIESPSKAIKNCNAKPHANPCAARETDELGSSLALRSSRESLVVNISVRRPVLFSVEQVLGRRAFPLAPMTVTRFSPAHAAEDADLVRGAQAGDEAAFGALYDRYARVIHGLLLARVPRADVDDLVQDVFLSAWNRLA